MIEPGYTLNERYRIKQTLGEGGMANVYLARDLILDRDVAVKVLRLDLQNDPDAARRFQREAQATSELDHPNIVAVYDVGESNGQQFLVMEYVHGSDLKKYIVEHYPIPYQRVVEIMLQVLSAVQLAHDHHVIHRDLKPQNILIDDDGNAKISDFGIAVALADNTMTQTNSLLGSVHYLSPEQARGSMPTRQSDIYALGIILFELLTGTVPFEGDSAVSVALKHFQEEMPAVRDFDSRVPQALENVVLKATTKDPLHRYTSAEAMASDLKTALDPSRAHEPKFVPEPNDDLDDTKVLPVVAATKAPQTAAATTQPPTSKAQKFGAWLKKRWPFVLAGVVLLAMVTGLVLAFAGGKGDVNVPDVRRMSQTQAQTALAQAKLKVGKVTKRASTTVTKNRVITSTPERGTSVKEGSSVDLIISRGQEKFTIRDYVGRDFDDVATDLEAAGFTVRKKTSTSDAPKNEILEQSLKDGEKVVPGKITLTVSKGPDKIKLRDLRGYDKKSVQEYAEKVGLNVSFDKEQSSDSVAAGAVISQSPAAGSALTKGDRFSVVLSSGPKPETAPQPSSSSSASSSPQDATSDKVTVPKLTEMTLDAAKAQAGAVGLALQISQIPDAKIPAGTVISQAPGPNITVDANSTIEIIVSTGPGTRQAPGN